jgi:hypothetical protein
VEKEATVHAKLAATELPICAQQEMKTEDLVLEVIEYSPAY